MWQIQLPSLLLPLRGVSVEVLCFVPSVAVALSVRWWLRFLIETLDPEALNLKECNYAF